MRLKLVRDTQTENSITGRLYCDQDFLCFTLENNWLDNAPRISCIPAGTYELTTKDYGRYWEKYKPLEIPILLDVHERSQILIHPGNYPKDTLGCILVGDSRGVDYVGNSRNTWKKFHKYFTLATEIEIQNCY